ncbi:uncharacterized protein IL334_003722 [Kwoniella shivajii]|uniref:NAD-dependent epimerase/dehydratase domain-containing protein n=1 Tax=Kwoniella shivajii TaxID=564305 RepID=A0ABZ1CYD6_9TREE|nr:hypothetical protein IL334_003722 [Kwoniella shivajii]
MMIDPPKSLGSLPTPEYTPINTPSASPINATFGINSVTTPLVIGITGSAGLVGTCLVELALDQGHTVLAMDIVDPNHQSTILPDHLKLSEKGYTYKQISSLDYEDYKKACKESHCNSLVHLAMIPNGPDVDGRSITGGSKSQNEVHNANVSMSYNTLSIAAELGINRVVLASSVNAIGMLFSKSTTFDYLPLDERHPCRPEDAYSLSKYFCELQSDSFVRKHPSLRVASLRFHGVVRPESVNRKSLIELGGERKDLWGWVSSLSVSRACLAGLTSPTNRFNEGSHETFFIVAPTICQQRSTMDLLNEYYPDIVKEGKIRGLIRGNQGLFDCSKAKRMLDWSEEGFYWDEDVKD